MKKIHRTDKTEAKNVFVVDVDMDGIYGWLWCIWIWYMVYIDMVYWWWSDFGTDFGFVVDFAESGGLPLLFVRGRVVEGLCAAPLLIGFVGAFT